MRLRAGDLAELLRRDTTHIYVCGLRGMEAGVEASFEAICGEHAQSRQESWQECRARMRDDGRFHVETY
jgi:benzoyl-CoA 2,3-dioxygenase component A